MACGVLPALDKQLLHFETWLTHRLTELESEPCERLLRRFATWRLLSGLRKRAAIRPLTPAARIGASEKLTQACAFLAWLADRDQDLKHCQQADLDAWHATHGEHCRRVLRAFLTWAMINRHMPRLALPRQQVRKAAPLSQQRRLELIRRAVTAGQTPLQARVAACLVLLYAQPITRIVRLTIDDIIQADEEMLIRLGDPPTPVPEPFAAMLLHLTGNRQNMDTATNPRSRWLFPGRRAGQPLNPGTMREQLRLLGFSAGTARPAALRQLVLQAPAPVVARSLGYHDTTTTRLAAETGGTWSRYTPGDHARSPGPRSDKKVHDS